MHVVPSLEDQDENRRVVPLTDASSITRRAQQTNDSVLGPMNIEYT